MNPCRLILDMVCIIAMVLCGGCALHGGDFARDGKLRIELSPPSGPLFYDGIRVAHHGDPLAVSGFGRGGQRRGHVVIDVIDPDGVSLSRARADPQPPAALPNRSDDYRFKVLLTVDPPPSSTLRVAFADSS